MIWYESYDDGVPGNRIDLVFLLVDKNESSEVKWEIKGSDNQPFYLQKQP